MPKKIFGLDIGGTSIKAVELVYDKKELKLFAADFIPTPPRGLASESDLDKQLLAGTVKKLVETAKIDTNLVSISLPENKVFTRVIEMPVLTDKELASAIKWESEQYIPVPINSVSLDWEVLSQDVGKNRMEVLLIGVPINVITKYEEILKVTGLEIVFIETEIIAASRALIFPQEKTPPTMIINIGANSADLGIFKNGMLVVTYNIPTGGNALTRAIAQEFNFELGQAEQYKKAYGLNEQALEGKIAVAIKPVLTVLLGEIKKAITFYQSKNFEDREIRRIILSGGDAKLLGLPIFFTNNLGIETEIANPWKKIKVDENLFKNQLENTSFYSVATGLALRVYGE